MWGRYKNFKLQADELKNCGNKISLVCFFLQHLLIQLTTSGPLASDIHPTEDARQSIELFELSFKFVYIAFKSKRKELYNTTSWQQASIKIQETRI